MRWFKRKLKTAPNTDSFGYKDYLGDWFGDGYKEVCDVLDLPIPLAQSIYDRIQPILEFGGTSETAQKLIRDERELIDRVRAWGDGTNRQIAKAFCQHVLKSGMAIRNYREWEHSHQREQKRDRSAYGMLIAINDNRDHEDCLRMHHTILPFGHPWWETHLPPHRVGCRCMIRIVTERYMKARTLEQTAENDLI